MSRDEGGRWLPIHTGLLGDETFLNTGRAREAWVVLYLALDNEPDPGWFKDRARMVFVLKRSDVGQIDKQIAELERLGWLVPENADSVRLTIRGWHRYTGKNARDGVYNRDRGDRSAEYARRPTTRSGRRDGGVTDGDGRVRTPRRDETRKTGGVGGDGRDPASVTPYSGPEKPSDIIERLRTQRIGGQPEGVVE